MPVSMSDHDLIAAARAGDRSALDALLRRHYDRIWTLCRRLAGNHADAQDATQEALIALTRGLASFDGRAAFTTWSYRVATNACLDELRRRSRRPVPGAIGFPGDVPGGVAGAPVAAGFVPGAPAAPAGPGSPEGEVRLDAVLDRLTIDAA